MTENGYSQNEIRWNRFSHGDKRHVSHLFVLSQASKNGIIWILKAVEAGRRFFFLCIYMSPKTANRFCWGNRVFAYIPISLFRSFIWEYLSFSILDPVLCRIYLALCALCYAYERKSFYLMVPGPVYSMLQNGFSFDFIFILFSITIYIIIINITVDAYVFFGYLQANVLHHHCCMGLVGVGDNNSASTISTIKKICMEITLVVQPFDCGSLYLWTIICTFNCILPLYFAEIL